MPRESQDKTAESTRRFQKLQAQPLFLKGREGLSFMNLCGRVVRLQHARLLP